MKYKPPSSRDGWKWMYDSTHWKMRRLDQLTKHPLCAYCLKRGVVKEAEVVHHVTRHNGDWLLFCNSPLESLCKDCHDNEACTEERGARPKVRIGLDGWPE